jgi:hypothetical protein
VSFCEKKKNVNAPISKRSKKQQAIFLTINTIAASCNILHIGHFHKRSSRNTNQERESCRQLHISQPPTEMRDCRMRSASAENTSFCHNNACSATKKWKCVIILATAHEGPEELHDGVAFPK